MEREGSMTDLTPQVIKTLRNQIDAMLDLGTLTAFDERFVIEVAVALEKGRPLTPAVTDRLIRLINASL